MRVREKKGAEGRTEQKVKGRWGGGLMGTKWEGTGRGETEREMEFERRGRGKRKGNETTGEEGTT